MKEFTPRLEAFHRRTGEWGMGVPLVAALALSAASAAAGSADTNAVFPGAAAVSVLVNQAGYDVDGDKILLVQVRDAHAGPTPADFALVDAAGAKVFGGSLVSRGRIHAGGPGDWGARYWSGDFGGFTATGTYRAFVRAGAESVTSFSIRVGPDALFRGTIMPAVRFFRMQRCGCAVPGFHGPCHLDDARIPDGAGGHRDAAGGWHDAGDFNKYASIACRSTYALLGLARSRTTLLSESERAEVLDEGLWGAAFLLKMWERGRGVIRHDVWDGYGRLWSPDTDTDNVPGTKDDRPFRGQGPSAMTAAALAAAARATGRAELSEAALDLWKGAVAALDEDAEDPWVKTCGGVAQRAEDVVGRRVRRTADLLLADLELEALTGDVAVGEAARAHIRMLCGLQTGDGGWPSDIHSRTVLGGVPAAALALYVRAHSGTEAAEAATVALRKWIEGLALRTDSPFGIVPWAEGEFFNPHQGTCWYVGQNSQYLSHAWALHLAAGTLGSSVARRLASRQFDWILGVNPYGMCMMEGQGAFNPPGYQYGWAPVRDRGAVPGAIPNGFCRTGPMEDRPFFGLKGGSKADWHTTEPWEPHNAFYILALTARSTAAQDFGTVRSGPRRKP